MYQKIDTLPLSISLDLEDIKTNPLMIRSISYVHDDGGLPIRDVRWVWTYVHGSRVCCDVYAVKVGMYVSYFHFLTIFDKWSAKVVLLFENANNLFSFEEIFFKNR